jgi:hypothetical protein
MRYNNVGIWEGQDADLQGWSRFASWNECVNVITSIKKDKKTYLMEWIALVVRTLAGQLSRQG